MLGDSILRRYALSRTGLVIGTALLLFATGRATTTWSAVLIGAAVITMLASLLTRGRSRLGATVCGDIVLPMDVDGANGIDLVIGSKNPNGQVGWLQSPASGSVRDLSQWKYHQWQAVRGTP